MVSSLRQGIQHMQPGDVVDRIVAAAEQSVEEDGLFLLLALKVANFAPEGHWGSCQFSCAGARSSLGR